jgi:sterol desaturase/sphingolipid hydroxylase (fatty acid hydroxylase superfamily)
MFEMVHMATHDGKHWQREFLKKIDYFDVILSHHMVHHTIKFNMNFALVNHWADYLFGTKYQAKESSILFVRVVTSVVLLGFLTSFLTLVYR